MTEAAPAEPIMAEAATADTTMTGTATTEAASAETAAAVFRSGLVSIVGRPNAGKSTLVNALVGQKVAIVSSRPQTTRHIISGVVDRPEAQLVLVDTPGLHKPRSLLGERLNALAREAWSQVDGVAVCFPSDQRIGPGDRFLIGQLAQLAGRPKLAALATKTDLVSPGRLRQHLIAIQRAAHDLELDWTDIVPVSALTGDQVEDVAQVLIDWLPPGPRLYPAGMASGESEITIMAEIIREACLELVDDELPHSIVVRVDEVRPRPDRPVDRPLLDVFASIVVERDSQKAIVLGAGGSRLKAVGTASRRQLERLLGQAVYLDLRVKVLKQWQRDPKKLDRLGF
ncbi:MAG: GTPase Era [Propionibacteriaceae bacterium]|jgi:GTP-binding protein Era|nr:GTPase Era [Propionibacteriaceae bacterium]